MNIPRHWARASRSIPQPGGGTYDLVAWGWSSQDRADAQRVAEERLARLADRVRGRAELQHGYDYGQRPMREEIIQELPTLTSRGGRASAVVTRNSYGSLILNTSDLLFIDVDAPPPPSGLFAKLFGAARRAQLLRQSTLDNILASLKTTPAGGSGADYRVYETAAGFRVMGVGRAYDPCADQTHALMQSLGADPAFVRLCRAQKCFRARLTPKPWRCGQPLPPGRHPREEPDTQAAFDRWLARYDQACRDKATCRLLETVGRDAVSPELADLVAFHDQTTCAAGTLPLA
ncbi:MAG: hypothetical protein IT442_04550 [Phycisphaeraceae bacterium]|nr:hypothetical protein [Phycisphaeraceae bacterium]